MRPRGELYRHMTRREIDVEPRDHGMYVVASLDVQGEGDFEGEVVDGYGVEVEDYDAGGVGDAGFHFDGVDEGFREGGVFEGGEVEAVDVVPD